MSASGDPAAGDPAAEDPGGEDSGVAAGWRAFVLHGPGAAAALAFLQVRAEFQGALEHAEDRFVVWLTGEVPVLPAQFDVAVEEQPVRADEFTVTGLEHDTVLDVAPGLRVRPPWVAPGEGDAGIELVVPRGAAFGSGEHDSTQAALALLHRTWPDPASFADIGTGSGILALYASERGCTRIEACDIDGPSVTAARELLPNATVHLGSADTLAPCDLTVANMTGDELHASLPAILAAWTGVDVLLLGGMRQHEVDGLLVALRALRAVTVTDREARGAFTALTLRS